jgi:pimeloyl-ACP methyl ester carboxylesterase
MPAALAATRIGARTATHALVLLHGIYGRGRNWQSIARAVVERRSEFVCYLLDLPHHGESPGGAHGDTVSGLAGDVADWMAREQIVPTAILGHSYGGKVALAVAERYRHRPLQIWVIDSTPEVKPPSGSAWAMLDVVRRLPQRFVTRERATEALMHAGYARGVAQWMTSNLARGDDGFTWKIDFDAMERLLLDFFTTDLWHVIEAPAPGHDIHFLKASESGVLSESAIERIRIAASSHVHLHERTGGHWIHAESPELVTELLITHLPR